MCSGFLLHIQVEAKLIIKLFLNGRRFLLININVGLKLQDNEHFNYFKAQLVLITCQRAHCITLCLIFRAFFPKPLFVAQICGGIFQTVLFFSPTPFGLNCCRAIRDYRTRLSVARPFGWMPTCCWKIAAAAAAHLCREKGLKAASHHHLVISCRGHVCACIPVL